jgi:hypothetical protein
MDSLRVTRLQDVAVLPLREFLASLARLKSGRYLVEGKKRQRKVLALNED